MSDALTGYEKNLSEFTRDELRKIAKTYGISLSKIIENKINKDSLIKLIEENELYKKANPKILQAQPTYNIIEKLKASDEILAKKYKEFGSRFVSQEWYRNAMFEALNNQPQEDTTDLIDTFGLQVGKFYFFSYFRLIYIDVHCFSILFLVVLPRRSGRLLRTSSRRRCALAASIRFSPAIHLH